MPGFSQFFIKLRDRKFRNFMMEFCNSLVTFVKLHVYVSFFSKIDEWKPVFFFQPFNCQDFHYFWTLDFIGGQSITQRSMGREAPRYPPQYPGS